MNTVTADQAIDDIGVHMEPALEDMSVDLPRDGGGGETSAGLEEERKGVLAGRGANLQHLREEGDGSGGRGGSGEGADEGVPHEGVGEGGGAEEAEGVGKVAGRGEGSEGKEAACGVVVGNAGGDDHLGMHLFELTHGSAAVGQEGERRPSGALEERRRRMQGVNGHRKRRILRGMCLWVAKDRCI